MTRKEFLKLWGVKRQAWLTAEVKAGRMRQSEAVLALAGVQKDGLKLWRGLRPNLVKMALEEWAKVMRQAPEPPAPRPPGTIKAPGQNFRTASKASPALIADARQGAPAGSGRPCLCDNCRKAWVECELAPIKDLAQRLDAGGEVPAGECPDCGALAYLSPPARPAPRIAQLEKAIAMLLEAWGDAPLAGGQRTDRIAAMRYAEDLLASRPSADDEPPAGPNWRGQAVALGAMLTAIMDQNHKLGAIARPLAEDARIILASWNKINAQAAQDPPAPAGAELDDKPALALAAALDLTLAQLLAWMEIAEPRDQREADREAVTAARAALEGWHRAQGKGAA